MIDRFHIGKIVNTHGVRGEVKILPDTSDINRFSKLKKVTLSQNGKETEYKVLRGAANGNTAILKLEGVDTPEQANLLRGAEIIIDRADAIKLPENTWFIGDLVGCEVFEEDGNSLGKLTNVYETGSNDVYEVTDELNRKLMVPALKQVLLNVDVENQKITVKLLPGLKEIYYEN